jgi:PAS domain S-box-containing protein
VKENGNSPKPDMQKPDPALFQLMAEQVRDYAVFLLDPEGRVMSWNAGARLIKGYSADEIIGRHFSAFYPEEALRRKWPEHELQVATREGRFEDESYRVRKDGSRFWANVIITALRDHNGKLIAFSKITRDLTDRRQQEEALRQSEERFRLLIEGVTDYAIYMLDPEGMITSWNAGAERIKGYRREEILGRHFSNFFTEEDLAAGKPWTELVAARTTGRDEGEGWRVRKNGERFWARVVITALKDPDGRLRGFAKVTQDLSQLRRTQELEEAARRVNEFIAMLAHEIRNPLAPIRNAVQLMEQLPPGDPRHLALRQTIDRQSAHLSRIADDMIDISRVTRGALSIEKKCVNLSDVLARSLEAAAPLIDASKHKLFVDLPPKALNVDGDMDRLTQVFTNLLNNAARYTPFGGSISVTGRNDKGAVCVRVRDTGRGIEAECIKDIFNMFVRGRAPLDRVGEGLGVGLALARNIVELHGGSIEAKSEGAGKGSEFIVTLPAAAGTAERRPSTHEAMRTPGAGKRILVVDDNVDAAQTLEMLLKALGHEAMVAYDGPQALEAMTQFVPDVVLLDIGLPGMNGYEVARRMRAAAGAGLRIVAITGWGKEDDRKRSAEAGFDLHLVKPVDAAQLRSAVENGGHAPGTTLH